MDSPKTALVGLGNPYHGDDAIGLIIARHLYESLEYRGSTDLLELSTCGFGVVERLLGYHRAFIIDALVNDGAEPGSIMYMPIAVTPHEPAISFHTVGFEAALALARSLDLPVPREITLYGIVILDPWSFGTRLSAEMESALPRIIEQSRRLLLESPSAH